MARRSALYIVAEKERDTTCCWSVGAPGIINQECQERVQFLIPSFAHEIDSVLAPSGIPKMGAPSVAVQMLTRSWHLAFNASLHFNLRMCGSTGWLSNCTGDQYDKPDLLLLVVVSLGGPLVARQLILAKMSRQGVVCCAVYTLRYLDSARVCLGVARQPRIPPANEKSATIPRKWKSLFPLPIVNIT